MAVSSAAEASQSSTSRSLVIPPLTAEEEDNVILSRITNDERPLKRVIKKFHNYTALSHTPVVPAVVSSGNAKEPSLEDAREAFLVELATFELSLKKSAMICEAEARQVEEYQRERQQINDEHGILGGQIEQLKTALEDAQMVRRRKIEYDLVAEKINTLPSREELERSIQALENDMTAIRAEHENQSRTLYDQKSSLDTIISQLDYLRFMGKDKDVASVMPSPVSTPAPEHDNTNTVEEAAEAASAPTEAAQAEEGEEYRLPSEPVQVTITEPVEDDIEMGEVEEPKNDKPKKKVREEELEEGEASDTSSALSDPPDD